jgi:signal transduction histidine kinase
MVRLGRQSVVYIAVLAGAFVLALAASWTALGARLDTYAYDFFFRQFPAAPVRPQSMVVAIDEVSLMKFGGLPSIRRPLAEGMRVISANGPLAVAVDVTLSDPGAEDADAALEAAFQGTRNLVLACDLIEGGRTWEDPLPRFGRRAAAVGHVHAQPDPRDGVNRAIPLEKVTTGRVRRWALALEAFRLSRGAEIVESPQDVTVGAVTIPAPRLADRLMRIRYLAPPRQVPRLSLKDVIERPDLAAQCAGKVVFVGVTAASAARDRLTTPVSDSDQMPGVEIHANAFETMAQGRFITDAWSGWELLSALALAAACGVAFRFLPGWWASLAAACAVAAALVLPAVCFRQGLVFSLVTPLSAAALAAMTAAAYQHLVARRSLGEAEAGRARYQQAMHFVTHEMKTPLTAIQGSSELMSRYALTEDKRKQIATMINSESKRLARMIEMFLNVERLSAGQIEMKRETFALDALLAACVERARVLAARKNIRIALEPVPPDLVLSGDRELIEYACYNLLSNAVKYSPPETETTVRAERGGGHVRIAVQDQGIGMDHKEVKQVFQKFYRTKKAEQSGEAGTGIGLSIVEQIVEGHGGAIEVTSRPGEGSCFTLVFPAAAPVERR